MLDPRADKAVLGSTGLIDMVGINIFDKKSYSVSFINMYKFISSIASGTTDFSGDEQNRQMFEEDFMHPVTSQWEEGKEPLGKSQYELLVNTLANGRINRDSMNSEILKMKQQGGTLVVMESIAQNLSLKNLIKELIFNVSPALNIK